MISNRLYTQGVLVVGFLAGISARAGEHLGETPPDASRPLAATGRDSLNFLLAEVRFRPRPGNTAFVELLNAGSKSVDLVRFVLRVGGKDLPLPRLADSVASGARVLVRFDGSGRTEKRVVHASERYTISADSGTIELLRDDRRPMDRVAWGTSSDPVALGDGGLIHPTLELGGSVGRPPGAHTPGAIEDWVVYPLAQVTPGEPNPLPAVSQLLPLDGVVIEDTTVNLAWYPVPGAAKYRVQVAADTTFARLAMDRTVTEPEVPGARLALGVYAWRVQAIDATGNGAAWSAPSALEIGTPGGEADEPEPDESALRDGVELPNPLDEAQGDVRSSRFDAPGKAGYAEPFATDANTTRDVGAIEAPDPAPAREMRQAGAVTVAPTLLNVPYLTQNKDTKMLLLEEKMEKGKHAWDVDHGYPSRIDPADTKNCAVANIAMINQFFGGNLKQDRIGYEVLSRNVTKYVGQVSSARCYNCVMSGPTTLGDALAQSGVRVGDLLHEVAPGAERDLVYGVGLDVPRTVAAMTYAVGAPPDIVQGYTSLDEFWSDVTAEILGGRPLVGANWHHAFVIRGFAQQGRRRFIYINDPANGQQRIDIGVAKVPPWQLTTFKFPTHPNVAHLEPAVSQDTDGDGVVDFDEVERFKTNPRNVDTDADGVHDKQDIRAGVFELEYQLGYAWSPGSNPGRDFDEDGLPTELDADSDWPYKGNSNGVQDGCLDGDEDTNGDGVHQGNESSNFNPSDDMCDRLSGVLSYDVVVDNWAIVSVAKYAEEHTVVHVKLKPDPNGSPGEYIDDGSTFTFQATGHLQIDTGDPACTMWANGWISTGGRFNPPDDEIAATRGDSVLTIGIKAERPVSTEANACMGGTYAGQNSRTVSMGDCNGQLKVNAAGKKTYVFDCTTSPPDGPGYHVAKMVTRGYVRVR